MPKKAWIGLVFFSTAQPLLLPAQTTTAPADTVKHKKKHNFIGVPVVDYTPETRFAFGLGGIYYFRGHDEDSTHRPSSIAGGFNYTQRHQYGVEIFPEMYFNHQKIRVFGKVQVFNFPDWFWGIGRHDVYIPRETYDSYGYNFNITVLFKMKNGFNIGPRYEFKREIVTQHVEGGYFDNPNIVAAGGTHVSGLGITVTHDTRDNVFWTSKGAYVELNASAYLKPFGSKYNFSQASIDLRKYYKVSAKSVFAMQLYTQLMDGTIPFFALVQMGGHNLMRGYYYGKYMDKNMIAGQAEYRFPLFWRFGMVAFAGVGNIEKSVGDMLGMMNDIKYAFGTGLRFTVSKKEKLNARFDIADGRDGVQYYLFFSEAF